MTEDEWRTSNDLEALLRFAAKRTSSRKLHLFGCACCRACARRDDELLFTGALYLAEQLADGVAASEAVSPAPGGLGASGPQLAAAEVGEQIQRLHLPRRRTLYPAESQRWYAVLGVLEDLSALNKDALASRLWEITWHARTRWLGSKGAVADEAGFRRQIDLLRDIVGDPFRPAPVRGEWLVWQDRLVPRMARAVYDENRFADLPVLADALEDAGCDDEAILGHLRSPGPHARGCWAVDLLVGT